MKKEIKKVTKMGRPKKDVNWKLIDKLLESQCPTTEITGRTGMSRDKLEEVSMRDFDVTWEIYSIAKRDSGLSKLREKQFELALEGDKTMLKWLGTAVLNQSEKLEKNVNVKELPDWCKPLEDDQL